MPPPRVNPPLGWSGFMWLPRKLLFRSQLAIRFKNSEVQVVPYPEEFNARQAMPPPRVNPPLGWFGFMWLPRKLLFRSQLAIRFKNSEVQVVPYPEEFNARQAMPPPRVNPPLGWSGFMWLPRKLLFGSQLAIRFKNSEVQVVPYPEEFNARQAMPPPRVNPPLGWSGFMWLPRKLLFGSQLAIRFKNSEVQVVPYPEEFNARQAMPPPRVNPPLGWSGFMWLP
ncbi:hypothetical protein EV426DRAFT_574006 [Tirmania nivea]|nr:hypothetical protein EV426DRAFT_574006 [Tirmania nivea]